ncbi:MAG TPA: hypothetical protein VHL11_20625, partial [Phototrophicaceae bacterium]|nr:hypothetical protein [Phototrophicaceae bacterium]
FILASDMHFQQAVDKWTWALLACGLFAAALNIMMPIEDYETWSLPWIALGLIYQMGRWMLTMAAMGLGHRYLNHTSNLLKYASEAAMPFYLLHMTFSVVTGYFVIRLDASVGVKYLLIVLIATGITLLAYELLRRWKVTRWLFGMKMSRTDGLDSETGMRRGISASTDP